MIEKIISSGQTGAARAAIDAAMKLGIAHGGGSETGEKQKGGPSLETRDFGTLAAATHSGQTKKNIQESSGTLLLTHGDFSGYAAFVKKTAARFHKPVLHVDLGKSPAFNAATLINDWVTDHDIRVLNVTGPRDEEDPDIYRATLDIIQAVFFLNLTEANMSNPILAAHSDPGREPEKPPRTVADAVALIINAMSLKDRATMANLREEELAPLQLTLGLYVKSRLDRWQTDEAFSAACAVAAEEERMDIDNPTMMLIKKLWKHLRDTHRLRRVK